MRVDRGRDVVIGYVETHGRKETNAPLRPVTVQKPRCSIGGSPV